MPRQTKLTQELTQEIVKLITEGDRPPVAAGVAGVCRSVFYDWMMRGRNGEEPYAGFRTEVARAEDQFASEMRRRVLEGDGKGESFGQAKAALEVMGRRFPKEWAAKVSIVLEEAESIWFDELQAVCADPDVLERVRQAEDLSPVFVAVCERIARRDSEGEASPAPSPEPAVRH